MLYKCSFKPKKENDITLDRKLQHFMIHVQDPKQWLSEATNSFRSFHTISSGLFL